MQRVLSFEHTPPLSLPLRFFLSAPLFALLAGAVVLWQGPDAFASRWSPAALAATHLITLGVLSMTMIGALLQILPVVAGVAIACPRLSANVMHALLCSGAVLLAGAFYWSVPLLFKLALPLLVLALVWLLTACASGLWRAPRTAAAATLSGIRMALGALLPTLILGAALAAGLAWALPVPLFLLTDLHVLWGLFGWIGLLLIGVALQVIPMFQITPLYPAWITRGLSRFVLLLLIADSIARIEGHWLQAVFEALLLAACGAFALVTLTLLARRKRPAPDATTLFWRTAMASLLACAALWFAPLDATARPLILGILFLLGFAYSAVIGMLYKILPFLLWYHWQEQAAGRTVPRMKLIIPERHAVAQFWSHLAALLLLGAAVVWPLALALARLAGFAFMLSSLQLGWNMLRALRAHHVEAGQSS